MCTPPPSRRHSSPPPRLIDDLIPEVLLRIPPDDPACLTRLQTLAQRPHRPRLPPPLPRVPPDASHAGLPPQHPQRRRSLHLHRPVRPHLLLPPGRPRPPRHAGHGRAPRPPPTTSAQRLRRLGPRHGRAVGRAAPAGDGGVTGSSAVRPLRSYGVLRCRRLRPPRLPPRALRCSLRGVVDRAGLCHRLRLLVGGRRVGRARGRPPQQPSRGEGKLSAFDVPSLPKNQAEGMEDSRLTVRKRFTVHMDQAKVMEDGRFTVTEDGRLGLACVFSSEFFLWSWEAGPGGAMAWKLRRNIQLNMIRTSREQQHKVTYGYASSQQRPCVIGFADGAGVVFVRTEEGAVFSVELNSGCALKTSLPRFLDHEQLHLPFRRFYTPVAGPYTKSRQIEEVANSFGEFLGDNKKKLDLEGDVDVQVQHSGYADKQRLMGESIDEQWQVWDAIHEQQKLKNQEERRQKQEKKKMMLDPEERRKKSAKIHESKMIREKGGGSRAARKLSQRMTKSSLGRLPLVWSLGVNMLRSPLGVLPSVATSKRGRCPSARDESTPIGKKAKSLVRSPCMPRSQSLTTSPLGGLKIIKSHD